MDEVRKEKSYLRKDVLDERDLLKAPDMKSKSELVQHNLFGLPEYKAAGNIMFFISFRSEVMTNHMIREALESGKNIIAPLSEKHNRTLRTFFIKNFNEDLTIGAYGILEPRADRCAVAKKREIDIVIVPGAVFSPAGDRLGYGVGYYDRFLGSLPEDVVKIALAYDFQITDNIPVDEKDVRMDIVVTEKRVIMCRAKRP